MDKQTKKQLSNSQAVKHLFASPMGREVLALMMKKFHIMKPNWADDPYTSAYWEGQRSVVLWVFQQLKLDVEAMANLIEQEENNG